MIAKIMNKTLAYIKRFWKSVVLYAALAYAPLCQATDFFSTRSYTNDVPGEALVTLDLSFSSTGICQAVEERLPGTLSLIGTPSADGNYVTNSHAIRWGPFFMPVTTSLTYRVSGVAGSYIPIGKIWADGEFVFNIASTPIVIKSPGSGSTPQPPPQVALPVITPASYTNPPVVVTFDCATSNAVMRYTLDGSEPLVGSTLYTGVVEVVSDAWVRVRGFLDGYTPSAAASAWFGAGVGVTPGVAVERSTVAVTGGVADVEIMLEGVAVSNRQACVTYEEWLPVSVVASNITASGVYDVSNSVVRWGPFLSTNGLAVLTYTAFGSPDTHSVQGRWSIDGYGGTTNCNLTIPQPPGAGDPPVPPLQVASPGFSPASSTVLPVDVTITSVTANAVIRYTLDGTEPDASDAVYSTPLRITQSTTLRARAFKSGMLASAAVSARYETPPQNGSSYMQIVRSITDNSSVLPAVTLAVTLTASQPECYSITEILPVGLTPYEIDSDGTWCITNRTIHWGPFRDGINRSLSYRAGGNTATYTLDGTGSADGYPVDTTGDTGLIVDMTAIEKVATPLVSPQPNGRFPVDVTLSCATEGAVILYTLDGTPPDEASLEYAGPIHLITITRIRAQAYKAWMLGSDPVDVLYGEEPPPADGGGGIVRTITRNDTPSPAIQLNVTPGTGTQCQSVTEDLPAGVIPSEISDGGIYIVSSKTIKWGPFRDGEARTLNYRLEGGTGGYELDGGGSFNGHPIPTTGDTHVEIVNWDTMHHEVTNNWSLAVGIKLAASPSTYAACYTVEEFLPDGLSATNITHGGIWNSDTDTIKWGPFRDGVSRDFSYTPVGTDVVYSASGRISVDGVSTLIHGDAEIGLGLPAPTDLAGFGGNGIAYLSWASSGHEAGCYVYYGTDPGGLDEVRLDAGDCGGFAGVDGLTNGVTYYFSVSAYGFSGTESEHSDTIYLTPVGNGGYIGKLSFDRDFYGNTDDVMQVSLQDRDLNTDPLLAESVMVHLSSDTDETGFDLTLVEAGTNSDMFVSSAVSGNPSFTFGISEPVNLKIRVREGDAVSVSYADALPAGTRTAKAQFSVYDSDGDGLPDWWEREMFGGYGFADGSTDFDEDESRDWTEYRAGTDPKDRESFFHIFDVEVMLPDSVMLRWSSVSGKSYSIQKSIDLRSGFYTLLSAIPADVSGTNVYEDVFESGAFYQVLVEEQ